MQKLTREDLYSLEQYSEARAAGFATTCYATSAIAGLQLGTNAALYFEDR